MTNKTTRLSLIVITVFTLLFTVSVRAAGPEENLSWQVIASGVEYNKFQTQDPNNIFVVRMDRANEDLTIESMISNGKLAEGRETVSSMYARYDQALNFWGGRSTPADWGMRNQAVVAINGSYFDWNSGVPQGGQIQDGWYAKRFEDLGGRTGFGWKLDRTAFIGECVYHRPEKQIITYPSTGSTQLISDTNTVRDSNQLILYTPQYNTRTGTSNTGVEVIIEMARPVLILPAPSYASGYVRQININQGNSLIPFNSIVLSATGTAAAKLLANVQVGSEVRISQEITPYLKNCETNDPTVSWTKTYSSVQGDYYFLKNGNIQDYSDEGAVVRNPRTAIAFNAQYIYFIVVDGRDSEHSIGMSIHQLAQFARDSLGATSGVAQDGGGSSTLVINGTVVNNTFCNNYTCWGQYKQYLPIVKRAALPGQTVQSPSVTVIKSAAGVERAVANGMLIVIAQPGEYSKAFQPGITVATRYDVSLRLGPGTNYDNIKTISTGAQGTVLEQMNGLGGVLAKSSNWWYVNFGGSLGWVPEEAITLQELDSGK